MSSIRYGLIALLCGLLAGCGVQMNIATPTVPTPTPRDYPNIDYSLGGIWYVQAQPHVAFFAPDRAAVEIFPRPPRSVYLIRERVLYLALDYDVTWYAAQQSHAQLRMTAYIRQSSDDPWESYETLERNFVTSSIPFIVQDTPSIVIYLEDRPSVEVRTEISLLGYLADGTTVTEVSSNTFNLFYLSDPGDVSTDPTQLTPALGDLPSERLLMDWRGWHGGPCALHELAPLDALERACTAYENGDWQALAAALTEAIDTLTDDNAWERAAAASQSGLVYSVLGDDETAATMFAAAVEGFSRVDDALQRVVGLHNWMTSLVMLGRDDEAYPILETLIEMRGQFYDELGEKLTQANVGKRWEEHWRVEEAYHYFADRESPLADVLAEWLDL